MSTCAVTAALGVLFATASAQAAPEPPLAPTPRHPAACEPSLYLEPSLFVGLATHTPAPAGIARPSNLGKVLNRIGVGLIVPVCRSVDLRVRVGFTAATLNFRWADNRRSEISGGGELEIDVGIAPGSRLGARLGVESMHGSRALIAIGGRYHLRDAVWFGIDGFVRLPNASDDPAVRSTGVMIGIGSTGKLGAILALIDFGLVVTGWLAYAAASGE